MYLNTDLFGLQAHLFKAHFLRTLLIRKSAKLGNAVTKQMTVVPVLRKLFGLSFLRQELIIQLLISS